MDQSYFTESYRGSASMDGAEKLVPSTAPRAGGGTSTVHIDNRHHGLQLVRTERENIPAVLAEIRARGGEYAEHVLSSVLYGCSSMNDDLNNVKSSYADVCQRMQRLEVSQHMQQIQHLDLADVAKKREKDRRVQGIKGIDAKREMATLIDLENHLNDQDKVLESLVPSNLDDLLKGAAAVPQAGYVASLGENLVDQSIGALITGHIRIRSRVWDQVRVLEAAAKSSVGKELIPYLQPTWDHLSAGTHEEKEAFDERVKAAEKVAKADHAHLKAQRQPQKGPGARGTSASLASNLTQSLKAGTKEPPRGGGGKPAAKARRKRKSVPRCHRCHVRGHMAQGCTAPRAARGGKP